MDVSCQQSTSSQPPQATNIFAYVKHSIIGLYVSQNRCQPRLQWAKQAWQKTIIQNGQTQKKLDESKSFYENMLFPRILKLFIHSESYDLKYIENPKAYTNLIKAVKDIYKITEFIHFVYFISLSILLTL